MKLSKLLIYYVMLLSCISNAEEFLKNIDYTTCNPQTGCPEHWYTKTPLTGSRVDDAERKGKFCLSIDGKDESTLYIWIQKGIQLKPGKYYTVRYSAKATKDKKYRVYVEWAKTGKDSRKSFAGNAGKWKYGTGKWQNETFRFKYPAGVLPAYICLRGMAPGNFIFRDVSIKDGSKTENEKVIKLDKISFPADIAQQFDKTKVLSLNQRNLRAIIKQQLLPGFYSLKYSVKADSYPRADEFPWFRASVKTDNKVQKAEWDDCLEKWQNKSFDFYIPEVCDADLVFEVKSDGMISIKNIILERTRQDKQALVKINIDTPYYRNTFFNVKNPLISGTIETRNNKIDKAVIKVTAPSGKRVFEKSYNIKQGGLDFAVQIPKPETGTYILKAAFTDSQNRNIGTGIQEIRYFKQCRPDIKLRKDNIFSVAGKPIFPMILWACPQSEKILRSLKNAGFNLFMSLPNKHIIDCAERNGLMVICRVSKLLKYKTKIKDKIKWEKYVRDKLQPLIKSPALFAYFLCDEPLWKGVPLNELRELYCLLKKLDPVRPVFINAAPRNSIKELAEFAEACDIYGVDIYPVPPPTTHSNLKDRTISCVGKYADKMVKSVKDRKPVWMALQGFAWAHMRNPASSAIYPSLAQLRFMVYDSIVNGATGIGIWGTNYIVDNNYWDTIMTVSKEVDLLSPIFTSQKCPQKMQAVSLNKNIKLLSYKYKGRLFVIAVNESDKAVTAKIILPEKVEVLRLLFEKAVDGGPHDSLELQFKPYGVHVLTDDMDFQPVLKKDFTNVFRTKVKDKKVAKYTGNANWIWYPGKYKTDFSKCLLKKSFNIKGDIKSAEIIFTADDVCTVYVNNKCIGKNLNWIIAAKYDLSEVLHKGKNDIYVLAEDLGAPGGFFCELNIVTSDGNTRIISDESWDTALAAAGDRINNISGRNWKKAQVIGKYGVPPWREKVFVNSKFFAKK